MAYNIRMGIPEMAELWNRLQRSYRDGTINKKDVYKRQEQAAIGIILSESMGQLVMGKWWLALFPGLCLVAVVVIFQKLGQSVCDVLDPGRDVYKRQDRGHEADERD